MTVCDWLWIQWHRAFLLGGWRLAVWLPVLVPLVILAEIAAWRADRR